MARFVQRLYSAQLSRWTVTTLECGMIVMVVALAGLGAASLSGPDLMASASRLAGLF